MYLNEPITNYTAKIAASRFDLNPRNTGYPAEFIQGKGSTPMMMGERLESTMRTIYSMEDSAAMRMMYTDPYTFQLPTGFPTSSGSVNSGEVYLNGNVLTMKP